MRLLTLLPLLLIAPAPAMAGISAEQCQAAGAYSRAHRGVAVLVLADGKPVCADSTGNDADTPQELWSGTKSFVGIMAAAAVQDGLLSLDERAADTLNEWRDDPQKSTITIRQLLSMAGGQKGGVGRPPSYADAVATPLAVPPGTRFQYSPIPMQIFGEILKRKLAARGMEADPRAYLIRRVLDPIGAKVGAWRDGADGNPLMPQGVAMTAANWARFGEFVRAGGVWQGKALIDPAAFRALFTPSPLNPAYGLTWWLPHAPTVPDPVTAMVDLGAHADALPPDMVIAAGAGDQRLYVIPSRRLTIVRQAKIDLLALMRGAGSGWSDADFLSLLGIGEAPASR